MGLFWEWDPQGDGMIFGWDGKNEIEERQVTRLLDAGKHVKFYVSHFEVIEE